MGRNSTKLGLMFLLKDTTQWRREARTHGPLVSSQALYHWATALPIIYCQIYSCIYQDIKFYGNVWARP